MSFAVSRHNIRFLMFFGFAMVASMIVLGGQAHAAQTDIVPSNADVRNASNVNCAGSTSAGCNVMIEVSYPGTGVVLDASVSWTKASYTSATGSIRIDDGCYGTASDYPRPGVCSRGTYNQARYIIYRMDANGNLGAACATITSNSTVGGAYILLDGWSPVINISGCLGAQETATSMYGIFIRADVLNVSTGGVGLTNAFRIQSIAASGQNSFVGYADANRFSTAPVAIQNRATPAQDPNDGPSTGIQNDFYVRTRQACNGGGPTNLTLRWQDADAGSAGNPDDYDLYFDLRVWDEYGNLKYSTSSTTIAGSGVNTAKHNALLGGQGTTRLLQFNGGTTSLNGYTFTIPTVRINPGDRIEWQWNNVRRTNGIQIYAYYDNNFYSAPRICGNVHGNVVTASCTQLVGWAFDYDRSSTSIRVYVYLDGDQFSGAPSVNTLANLSVPLAPVSGNHGFSINPETSFPSIKDFGTHRFYVYGQNIDSTGTAVGSKYALNNGNPTPAVGPCAPVVSCGNAVTAPTLPEAGEPFSLTVNVTYPTASPAPSRPTYKMALYASAGISNLATNLDVPYTATSTSTSYTTAANLSAPAGSYNIGWTFIGPGVNIACSLPITVAAKPYVHVYNGDASGTATFTCGVPSTGGLRAYNKGSAGGYAGSGAQIATLAASVIDGFTSASMRAASPLKPTGLAFANTSGAYGGNFVQTPCVSDFWATAPSLPALGYSVNGTVSSGHYSSPGGGTTVANPGTSYILYANGDVYLNGDTKFAGGGSSWNVNNLPYFWLIVKGGNIYIKNSVAQLDGVYVSIPNGGAGGKIYTCSVDDGAGGLRAPTAAEMSTGCGAQLRINGAFIANQVKLLRTANTLRMSVPGEGAATSKAAEVFTFSPEIWLRSPITTKSTGDGAYDAYSTLPPVL